ncbi:MAG: hypothetical protein GC152_12415 [Alphaproteobacteria bacterium]|nr:hypothetical protein [Alphaproteobacteria bacterium]
MRQVWLALGAAFAFQTALLVAVASRTFALDAKVDALTADLSRPATAQRAGGVAQAGTAQAGTTSGRATGGATIAEIEAAVAQIVRTEITSALPDAAPARGAGMQQNASRREPTQAANQTETPETTRILGDIERDIQAYAARGTMSEAEMAALQTRMASLPPSQRSAALSALSRAITVGGLDARF